MASGISGPGLRRPRSGRSSPSATRRRCPSATPARSPGTHRPCTISSCAARRREELDAACGPPPSCPTSFTTPAPDTLAWAPAPSWSGHAGATGKSASSSSARGQVVVVGEADVAVAGLHPGEQLTVAVVDLRVVVHPRLQQCLGRLGSALGEEVGDERLVVLAVRRAQARAALPLRIAQVFVAGDLALGDALRRHDRHPQAHGQRPPLAAGIAHRLGHVGLELGAGRRGEQASFSARHRLARSVVTSTSAGVSQPSRFSRSNSSGPVPPRRVSSMPVASVNSSKTVSSP